VGKRALLIEIEERMDSKSRGSRPCLCLWAVAFPRGPGQAGNLRDQSIAVYPGVYILHQVRFLTALVQWCSGILRFFDSALSSRDVPYGRAETGSATRVPVRLQRLNR